eukprot:COSAG04_NODE_501_length_13363_cov_9.158137_5_plen_759_part_00
MQGLGASALSPGRKHRSPGRSPGRMRTGSAGRLAASPQRSPAQNPPHRAMSPSRIQVEQKAAEVRATKMQLENEKLKAQLSAVRAQQTARTPEETELARAAYSNELQTMERLIAEGVSADAKDEYGNPVLLFAASEGHLDALKLLHKHGAKLEATGPDGWTALMDAALNGKADCAEALLEWGADKDAAAKHGGTALHYAASNGQLECARLLVRARADRAKKDKEGKTALELARQQGKAEVAALLEQAAVADAAEARQETLGEQRRRMDREKSELELRLAQEGQLRREAEESQAEERQRIVELQRQRATEAERAREAEQTAQAEREARRREMAVLQAERERLEEARAREAAEHQQRIEQAVQQRRELEARLAREEQQRRTERQQEAARSEAERLQAEERVAAQAQAAEVAEQQRHELEERMRQLEEQQQAERQAHEEQLRLAQQEPEPEPEPDRTFATSHFKMEYDKARIVPITRAAQIIGKIPEFIHTYCHVHGRDSEADVALAEAFVARLQEEAGQHAEGGAGNLMADVRHTAELLWTSQSTFRGMDDHNKEFCSLLNAAIRDDEPALAGPAAALSRGLNEGLCTEGRAAPAAVPFPDGGLTLRGGGFDDVHQGFFTVGKQFRVPGFLATSFERATALRFVRQGEAWCGQGILWVVRVDPTGEHDPSKRCKHVNFVSHSLIVDHAGAPVEREYLFAAYSIFTVRSVEWNVEIDAATNLVGHRIELDAASDNRAEAEGGAGQWATPVGSEGLPLAPWY